MAPRKGTKAAKPAAKAPAKSAGSKTKPLSTGDIKAPEHVYQADLGQGLPPQADTLNPNRAK